MDARLIDRIETNVERGASALFAAAVGFAAYMGLRALIDQSEVAACTVAAVAIAYLLSSHSQRAIASRKRRLAVPVFDLRDYESSENGELLLTERVRDELVLSEADRFDDELVLTEADRFEAVASVEPLVLDDILAELGPDARVVRLFDRKAMPTPGQLKARIDDHLSPDRPSAGASDASQALSDALAQLRRSLR
jgi:hypothetical protein